MSVTWRSLWFDSYSSIRGIHWFYTFICLLVIVYTFACTCKYRAIDKLLLLEYIYFCLHLSRDYLLISVDFFLRYWCTIPFICHHRHFLQVLFSYIMYFIKVWIDRYITCIKCTSSFVTVHIKYLSYNIITQAKLKAMRQPS